MNLTPLAQALQAAGLRSTAHVQRAVWMSPHAFWMGLKGLRFKHKLV